MKSDKSRETFNKEKHYSSVRLQQGRVLTDADWNEQSDIGEYRDETTTRDVVGQAGVPVDTSGAFELAPSPFTTSSLADFTIGTGRMYVEGILIEHEQFTGFTSYRSQPDPFFNGDLETIPTIPTGLVLAYVDVWERHIGVVEDPFIREVALGGPDTATRAKTVWQVKTTAIDNGTTADETLEAIRTNRSQTGFMSAHAKQTTAPTDPCIIPQAAGFRSLENQLYRVEVHTPGELIIDANTQIVVAPGSTAPTFKWSRENGSVVAAWIDDPHPLPNTVRVKLLTNDPTRGFSVGNWVELSDDRRELSGLGGVFVQLINVDGDLLTYDPNPAKIIEAEGVTAGPISRPADRFHPTVRRWDMPTNSAGPVPILDAASIFTSSFFELELGVEIRFDAGKYFTGDYWTIAARTASNSIEWPPLSEADPSTPALLPPFGIKHHYACLATFDLESSGFNGSFHDCRKIFHPLTDLTPPEPVDVPQPDEYRYYLIDGSGAIGDDLNGFVGIDLQASVAYSKARAFATSAAALARFPRQGNGSIAVIMFAPIGGDGRYDQFSLQGVSGYRHIVIRGSAFVRGNEGGAFKIDPLDDSDWVVLGAQTQGPFGLNHGISSSSTGNVVNVDPATLIGADLDALVGTRLRFVESSTDLTSMVLGNVPGVAGVSGDTLTIGDTFANGIPGGGDTFVLETPGVHITFFEVAVSGSGDEQFINRPGVVFGSPNLSIAGFDAVGMRFSGAASAEIAFCSVGDLKLNNFGHVKVTPDYRDEFGSSRSSRLVGVGVNALGGLFGVTNGDVVDIANSAGNDTGFRDVESVHIPQGFFASRMRIIDCSKFSIGAELADPTSSPHLIRIGSNVDSGTALQISNSDGAVLGTAFDITNIHAQSKTAFDFADDDSVDLSAIQFEGTGRSLRLRDVSLSNALVSTVPSNMSGVLLDMGNAVKSIVDYDPTKSGVVSGLITLPGRTFFRPFELAYTDFRDAHDNHILSPSVSSTQFKNSFATIGYGQGRTFTQRGIPVQAITSLAGESSPVGVPRYRVVQFAGDGTSRVRVARIDMTDAETKVATTAIQIAAAIAGVMQQTIQPNEDRRAFGMCIPSGYTLIALQSTNDLFSTKLPAPLYCSEQWGLATVSPTRGNEGLAIVRIGVLIRIVVSSGLGDSGSGDGLLGLARFEVDPNAVAGEPNAG